MVRSMSAGLVVVGALSLGAWGQPGSSPHGGGAHPQVGHPEAPPAPPADWPKAAPEDVASVDAIMAAYYASTAGRPKEPRDWNRFLSLFQPEARLMPVRPMGGGAGVFLISPREFVEKNRNYLEKGGFVDKEIARRTETYGHMTQVWSTFESRHSPDDPAPYARGVASLQLLQDGQRWWIVNIMWEHESQGAPIPEKYTKPAGE